MIIIQKQKSLQFKPSEASSPCYENKETECISEAKLIRVNIKLLPLAAFSVLHGKLLEDDHI